MTRLTISCLAIALLCAGCGRGIVAAFDDLPESEGVADAPFPRLSEIPERPTAFETDARDARIDLLVDAGSGAEQRKLDSGVDALTSARLEEVRSNALVRAQATPDFSVAPIAVPQRTGSIAPPQIDRDALLVKAQQARSRMPERARLYAEESRPDAPPPLEARPNQTPKDGDVLGNTFRDAARRALSRKPGDVLSDG